MRLTRTAGWLLAIGASVALTIMLIQRAQRRGAL